MIKVLENLKTQFPDSVGIVVTVAGRVVYIEFDDIKKIEDASHYVIKTEKIYEITLRQVQDQHNRISISVSVNKFNNTLFKSKYLVFDNLSAFEIIDRNSDLYKVVVNSRSKIQIAGNGKENFQFS